VTRQWFSLGTAVSSINKTDRHVITEVMLKVALNTLTLAPYKLTSDNTTEILITKG